MADFPSRVSYRRLELQLATRRKAQYQLLLRRLLAGGAGEEARMLTIDQASELCEFLADCHEEFPDVMSNVCRFLSDNPDVRHYVLHGYHGTGIGAQRLAYDVGRWAREVLG